MKTLLLFVLLSMTCFGALSNSALDIKLKESLHLLSIQGKKATAAEQTLELIETKDLTKKQAQQIYPVLLRTMQAANQQELISQAITACKSHQIKCDKLEELFLFAAPESANPNTAAIQESLEYMWNNFDWRTDEADLKYFNQYLEKMGEREDLPLIARVQAGIVNFSIFATHYWDNKDSMQEEQFQTLLSDLNNTDNSYSASTIYASIKRLELTAKKYAAAGNYEMALYLTKMLRDFSLVVGETQSGSLTEIFCDKINIKIKIGSAYFPTLLSMSEKIYAERPSLIFLSYRNYNFESYQKADATYTFWPFATKLMIRSGNLGFSVSNNLLNSDLNSARITWNAITNESSTYRYGISHRLLGSQKYTFSPTNSIPWVRDESADCVDSYNNYKSKVAFNYPKTKITEICNSISNTLLAIGPTINDLKEYAETHAASKPKKRLDPNKKLSELEVRDLLLKFSDIGTRDTKAGIEILETLQPYMSSNRAFNALLLNYPNNRIRAHGNVASLMYNYIENIKSLDMKWMYWRDLPSCLEIYKAMQLTKGNTNKFDIRKIFTNSSLQGSGVIGSIYKSVGVNYDTEYDLYTSRIIYEYKKYYVDNFNDPREFTFAYLIELMIPLLVEKSDKINSSYSTPDFRHSALKTPTNMMFLDLALETIKAHPNNASKPKFTEKTLKKLVKDLREYGQKNREKE